MIEQDTPTPDARPRRFDERGIALQTIIIIVVLISIAGAIALVLFNRASEETGRLQETETVYDRIDSPSACSIAGGRQSSEESGNPANIVTPTTDPGDGSSNYKRCYPPG